MSECQDAVIKWYDTLTNILVSFVFIILVSFIPISALVAISYSDDIRPADGEQPVVVETNDWMKYRKVSPEVLVDAVNKQRELPEGIKTLISDGATKIDEDRLYLTSESVAEFLSSDESLKAVKDKVSQGMSPVLTEIPLEPENPDSATFWLYYGGSDDFYINHSELPANSLWEDVHDHVKGVTDKSCQVAVFTSLFFLLGVVLPTMLVVFHLGNKADELRYGKNA